MDDPLLPDPKVDEVLKCLWRVPGWPKNVEKDEALARDLVRKFPTLNVPFEVEAWGEWMQVNADGLKKEVNHRARVRTWLRNGVRYRSERGRLGRSRPVAERSSRNARRGDAELGW